MNKVILLASLALGGLVSAQQSGKNLERAIQQFQDNVNVQREFFEQQLFGHREDTLEQTPITEANKKFREFYLKNRNNIAFFVGGMPVFLKSNDTDQNKTSNVEAVQNGEVAGLEGDFLGEGIHISVFDGGKALETHTVFQDNGTSRVNNKETDPEAYYDEHATAVTSMIGGKDNEVSFTQSGRKITGNTRGVLPKATFDNFVYSTTVIDGRESSVARKLLMYRPALSNHSWGTTAGWSGGFGQTYYGYYSKEEEKGYDLMGAYQNYDFFFDFIVHSYPEMIMVKAAGNAYGQGPSDGLLNYYYDTRMKTDNDEERMGLMADFDLETFEFKAYTPPPANCELGYDCIETGSVAKNIIIVGATDKIANNQYTQASDVVKASYSNAGPRDDGAIKPDIASVGSDVISASYKRRATTDQYEQGSGTSYSTPHITGIIGMWQEIYKTLFGGTSFDAASAKNLLTHTAQEAGKYPGPDVHFGWGFADAKAGAELLVKKANEEVIFENKTLENNDKHELYLESDGTQPLKVSISWIDPPYFKKFNDLTWKEVHNDRTSMLINDLDLRITNTATGEIFYPWKLDIDNPINPALKGDNTVDNIEQVLIETPEKGTYKVEITHKGNLVEFDLGENDTPLYTSAPQEYNIIATGFNKVISNDVIDSAVFNIYPTLINQNDAEKLVNINVANKAMTNVSVYDISGRLIKSEDVNAHYHQIDFSTLPKGVYVVDIKLASSKETITRKVLKR